MPYILLVLVALVVVYAISFLAFRAALNNSNLAKELKEIRILLMQAQNDK